MAVAGVSTLGIKVGYALETTAGTKPAAFTLLTRINEIGGISLSPETIDASALEDTVSRSVSGRADTSSFDITVNLTDATITEWETLIAAYKGRGSGLRMWMEFYSPDLQKAFFVAVVPPTEIPMPDMSQNELMTVAFTMNIDEFIGLDTAVIPS